MEDSVLCRCISFLRQEQEGFTAVTKESICKEMTQLLLGMPAFNTEFNIKTARRLISPRENIFSKKL